MKKIYRNINEIPDHSRKIIKRLIENGIITFDENDELNLTDEMIRIYVSIARLGAI